MREQLPMTRDQNRLLLGMLVGALLVVAVNYFHRFAPSRAPRDDEIVSWLSRLPEDIAKSISDKCESRASDLTEAEVTLTGAGNMAWVKAKARRTRLCLLQFYSSAAAKAATGTTAITAKISSNSSATAESPRPKS
jgi:hypothetical protein